MNFSTNKSLLFKLNTIQKIKQILNIYLLRNLNKNLSLPLANLLEFIQYLIKNFLELSLPNKTKFSLILKIFGVISNN